MLNGKAIDVMKKIISLLFIFISLSSFSQTTKEIKITEKQLADAKAVADIISDIPKDCKIQSYVVSYSSGSDLREYTCITNLIGQNVKDFIIKKEKDKFFFIENIKSSCEKSPKGKFKITIE